MNYYSHHIGDYRRDTSHLSLIEHGAYRQLLDMYYLSEQSIPRETEVVFRRLCARTDEEKTAVITVLNEFFTFGDGWIHKRCENEICAYLDKADRARENGKLGGRPKKTNEVISGNPDVTEVKANHKPITINQEPLKTKDSAEAPNYRAKNDLLDSGVDEQTATDWLALRKAKKAPVSKTALDAIKREVAIAGLPLGSALVLCCERGWAGFKAEWVHPQRSRQSASAPMDIAAAQRAATEEGRRRLFGDIDEMVTINA